MPKRFYVYRLFDQKNDELVFQGRVEIPVQSDDATMNDDDARSMVADAAIRQMIRSSSRPAHSLIQYCELQGEMDERLSGEDATLNFDWDRCELQELELNLGKED
ncbi:MAG: hypothetical protein OQK94_06420 [Gammaproteobacteria bacterium]|nr:hypothetical protein [Gammaproteobacteria bacterium]MCW8840664.1 hypothetical protein [Gammaproteobacteria bacterium]MCW8927461.1 hypothetical protein [Gammaproteobacteria bacterium]MCW8958756.1 hypothetical protein [Gammaproteobacteria bacterium]MCW8973074.1 hypothetical protein [Gammaproteobacteria bacterium]